MANFLRLVAAVFVLLFASVYGIDARATGSPPNWAEPETCGLGHEWAQDFAISASTPDAAAASWNAQCNPLLSSNGFGSYASTAEACVIDWATPSASCKNNYAGGSFDLHPTASCPSGTAYQSSTYTCEPTDHTCPDGQSWNGSQCVSNGPCGPDAGKSTPVFVPNSAYNPGALYLYGTCAGQCGVNVGSLSSGYKSSDGTQGWLGIGTFTGQSCTPSSGGGGPVPAQVPSTNSPPSSCPAGQYWGQVNGQTVCVPGANGASGGNYQQKSNTSTTSTPNPSGGDPSTSSTTTNSSSSTQCDGKTCTTTTTSGGTTSTNPGGAATSGATVTTTNPTTTTTTQQPQQDFCAQNPRSALCKQTAISGGGNCTTPITQCDGDAVLCAIAKEQQRQYCEMNPDNELSQKGTRIVNGTETLSDDPRLPGNVPTVSMASAINTDNALPGTCPANPTFSIMGKEFSIPYSTLCPYLEFMGSVAVFAAMICAAMIVFGRS